MTGFVSTSNGRFGIVARVLPHGSVIVYDPETHRSYPFYKAGLETFHAKEEVRFVTDETDTVIVSLRRVGGAGRGTSAPDGDYEPEPIAALGF